MVLEPADIHGGLTLYHIHINSPGECAMGWNLECQGSVKKLREWLLHQAGMARYLYWAVCEVQLVGAGGNFRTRLVPDLKCHNILVCLLCCLTVRLEEPQ